MSGKTQRRHGKQRFTDADVLRIRTEFADNKCTSKDVIVLAKLYNTKRNAIWRLLRGESYKDAGGPIYVPVRVWPHETIAMIKRILMDHPQDGKRIVKEKFKLRPDYIRKIEDGYAFKKIKAAETVE